MKKLLLLCLSVLTASCDTATRQFESRLDEILSGHKAFVGVAVRTPGGETIARNDTLLPMMSVFKFPVALAVLDRMQREGIPLTQPISITPDLLLPGTYSPMRDSLPAGGGTLTLGQLLRYMVSESDNIACDILLREAGGPEAVEAYVRSLGIGGIRIAASEEEMHRGIGNQRVNKARPSSVCTLFDLFLQGRLLKGEYNALLQRLLRGTTTGTKQVRPTARQKASASRTTMSAMWFYPTDAATVSRCSSPNRKKTTPRMRLSPPRHPGRPTNISAQNRRLWTISQK